MATDVYITLSISCFLSQSASGNCPQKKILLNRLNMQLKALFLSTLVGAAIAAHGLQRRQCDPVSISLLDCNRPSVNVWYLYVKDTAFSITLCPNQGVPTCFTGSVQSGTCVNLNAGLTFLNDKVGLVTVEAGFICTFFL